MDFIFLGCGGRLEELKKNERKNYKLCRDKVNNFPSVCREMRCGIIKISIPLFFSRFKS